jgi:hypothetical protein
MLREAYGEPSLSRTAVFELHSRFKVGWVPVEDDNFQDNQEPAKRNKMLKKFDISSMKTVAEQSMSSQTAVESVMKFVTKS